METSSSLSRRRRWHKLFVARRNLLQRARGRLMAIYLREVMSLRHCVVCRSPEFVQVFTAGSCSLYGQGEVTRLVMTWHWRADHRDGRPITEEYAYEPRIRAFFGSLRRRRDGKHTLCIHATLPPPPTRDNDGDLDTSLPGALLEHASDALCHFVLRHPRSCGRDRPGPRSWSNNPDSTAPLPLGQ